jgi:hypothetical protein
MPVGRFPFAGQERSRGLRTPSGFLLTTWIGLKLAEPVEVSLLGIQGELLDAQNVPGLVENTAPAVFVYQTGVMDSRVLERK